MTRTLSRFETAPRHSLVCGTRARKIEVVRTVTRREDLAEALHWARSTPGPVLLEVRVKAEETVLPMVPAGAATGELICVEGRVLR